MRKARGILAIALSLLSLHLTAVNVQWGWCVCERFSSSSWVIGYSNDGDPVVFDSSMMMRMTSQSSTATFSAGRFGDLATATWMSAVIGDVITDVMFSRVEGLLLAQRAGAVVDMGVLTTAKNESFYLAVKVEGFDWTQLFAEDEYILTGDVRYGWVELHADETGALTAVSSAWDLDGGAMYVGGGAVPEPSSPILMLLGLSGLALRRRKGMCDEQL